MLIRWDACRGVAKPPRAVDAEIHLHGYIWPWKRKWVRSIFLVTPHALWEIHNEETYLAVLRASSMFEMVNIVRDNGGTNRTFDAGTFIWLNRPRWEH